MCGCSAMTRVGQSLTNVWLLQCHASWKQLISRNSFVSANTWLKLNSRHSTDDNQLIRRRSRVIHTVAVPFHSRQHNIQSVAKKHPPAKTAVMLRNDLFMRKFCMTFLEVCLTINFRVGLQVCYKVKGLPSPQVSSGDTDLWILFLSARHQCVAWCAGTKLYCCLAMCVCRILITIT